MSSNLQQYLTLGWELYEAGEYEAALQQFQEASRLAPDQAEPHFQIGQTYEQLGQTDAALSAYNKAMQLDPNNVNAYLAAAGIYQKIKDEKSERAVLHRASMTSSDSAGREMALGWLAAIEQNQQKALEHYRNAAELDPDNTWVAAAMGRSLLHLRRDSEAREAFLRATAQLPNRYEDLYFLGFAEYRLRNFRAAEAAWKTAVAIDPNNDKAYRALAALKLRTGQLVSAWHLFREAMSRS